MAIRATVPSGVFTRQSSGLVRQVGTLDTLFYCHMQVAIGFLAFIMGAWHFYPGASMELATLIVMLAGVALAIVYGLFSSVYPRSGGEYVFVSRSVHSAIGLMVSVLVTFGQAFGTGTAVAFVPLFGLAPLFGVLGLLSGNQALTSIGAFFQSPWGIFLGGSATVLFFGVVLWTGVKTYFTIQRWSFWAAAVSFVVTLVVLALSSLGAFQANFDSIAGAGAYQQVLANAQAEGVDLNPPFSLWQTLAYTIWPVTSLLFAILSVSFNGEIKNVRTGQLIGISGAIVLNGAIMIAIMFLARRAMGDGFLIAANSVPGDQWPVPIGPGVNLFISIAGNNVLLAILTNIWAVVSVFYVGGTTALYATRALLAWAIDGIVPDKVGGVSERYHSPTTAIIIVVVLAEVALALFAFTTWVTLLTTYLWSVFAFLVVALAGMAFPFLRKQTFENSPAAIRVAGIPLITLAGLVAAAALLFSFYRILADDNFGGNGAFAIWTFVGLVVIGLAGFYLVRLVRRGQGVDIDSRFREIPIE
jgi:amino acid transporter